MARPRTRAAARPGCRRAARGRAGTSKPLQRRLARARPSSRSRSACARCPRARASRPAPLRTRSSPAIPIQTPSRGSTPAIAGSRLSALSSTRCGSDALGDDPRLAVDVGDERVERAHALREAGRDAAPSRRRRSRAGRDRRARCRRRRPSRSGCPRRRSRSRTPAASAAEVVREHGLHHGAGHRPDRCRPAPRRRRIRGRAVAVERRSRPSPYPIAVRAQTRHTARA